MNGFIQQTAWGQVKSTVQSTAQTLLLSGGLLWGAGPAESQAAFPAARDGATLAQQIRQDLEVWQSGMDETEQPVLRAQAEFRLEEWAQSPADVEEQEFERLRPLLEEAATRGLPAAAFLLGFHLRERGQMEESFRWFLRAATEGHAPAMVQVGLMYSNGDGVEPDLAKASDWLRPANVKGSAVGKYLLAECFLFGKGVERNPAIAVTLLQEAVAMQPIGRALDLLGTCHHKGWGVERDPLQAVRYYQQACESGFHNAFANLAVLYMTGDGVAKDTALAVELLRAGIEKAQNPLCMYFLGLAYQDGLGVRRSARRAERWMRRAASAGNPQARAWCDERGIFLSDK